MDASHIFPHSVLAVIPLIWMWLVVLCPGPVLDMKRGFLFALWLSLSLYLVGYVYFVYSPVVRVQAPEGWTPVSSIVLECMPYPRGSDC